MTHRAQRWFGDGNKSTKAPVELFEGTQRNAYDKDFENKLTELHAYV